MELRGRRRGQQRKKVICSIAFLWCAANTRGDGLEERNNILNPKP